MESNRKRNGFIKGKLIMPLYRVAKSSSASSTVKYSSKVKPSQSSPATASVGYAVNHQDYVNVIAQPMQKVSFVVSSENNSNRKKLFGEAGDESVDIKAASYISSVQERFKLEVNVLTQNELPNRSKAAS